MNLVNKYKTKEKKKPELVVEVKSESSECITEELNHVNDVNPVALAEKEWTDEYKLEKLMKQ